MSHEEFRSQNFGYRPDLRNGSELQQTPFRYVDAVTPKEVDWHAKGAVTKVKNQAQVGAESFGCSAAAEVPCAPPFV